MAKGGTGECNQCRFWTGSRVLQERGQCQRYPPIKTITDATGMPIYGWPLTEGRDRCGEYQDSVGPY